MTKQQETSMNVMNVIKNIKEWSECIIIYFRIFIKYVEFV